MENPTIREHSFSRPIPGQGLTAELGGRPWQNPPQMSTVEEAADFYIQQITTEAFTKSLIHTLETGVPMTVIANSMQTVGVMEGRHSLDIGILLLPILMEAMMLIADKAGIKYDSGIENENKLSGNELASRVVAENMPDNLSTNAPSKEPVIEKKEPTGLMSPRRV